MTNSNNDNNNQQVCCWMSWVFCLLGIGVLVPWNAFISARRYFEARLPCGVVNIELWFSLVYNVASVLSLVVLLWVQRGVAKRKMTMRHDDNNAAILSCEKGCWTSLFSRKHPAILSTPDDTSAVHDNDTGETKLYYCMTMGSLALYLLILLGTTLAVALPNLSTWFFAAGTLVGLFVCGICTSVASAGIVGTAGLFDADQGVGPYFQGQAAGGLLVALANLVAAACVDPNRYRHDVCESGALAITTSTTTRACLLYDEISWTTLAYFALGTLSIAACMVGYHQIETCKARQQQRREHYTPIGQADSSFPVKGGLEWELHEPSPRESTHDEFSRLSSQASSVSSSSVSRCEDDDSAKWVWHETKWLTWSLFLTYVATLAIFPAITSDLTSTQQCQSQRRIFNDLYVPMTFVVFNLGDLVGRFAVTDASSWAGKIQGLDRLLFWASVARWVFVPLFLLCWSLSHSSLSLYQKEYQQSAAIASDLFSWAVQFLFAVSNGMITTMCFSHAPSLVPSTEDIQQTSSAMLNLSLCSGLLVGSFLSFPLLWAFKGNG